MALRKAVLTLSFAAALASGQTQATGRISGTVVDENGLPVPGATVMVDLQPTQKAVEYKPFHKSVRSDEKGAYTITNMPAGRYVVCADKREALMVNLCVWSDKKTEVSLGETQDFAGAIVSTAKGCLLEIRLKDDRKLLQKQEGKSTEDRVTVSAFSEGGRFHLGQVTTDDGGKSVKMLVPFDTPITIVTFSPTLRFADESGKVPIGHDLRVTHTAIRSRGDRQTVKVVVAGTNAK